MQDLPQVIQKIDQKILSSSGIDSFEEVIKIILLKLYDEMHNKGAMFASGNFHASNSFLKKADKKWPGCMDDPEFNISEHLLNACLEMIRNTNISSEDISAFDTAIEYLLPHTHRGNRGQFMTPRHITEEIVKMMHPGINEKILDPACGSGGFLEYAILLQNEKNRKKYAQKNIFGIDYDRRMRRIAHLISLKTSGASAQITTANSLTLVWKDKFDVVISNPPYGGRITDENILKNFKVAKKGKENIQSMHRHVLFIEKCIEVTKPGGRIALILPQGALNNTRMKKVHDFIFDTCRLTAVISLPQSTFMPHTNVKTSIVILQKWDREKEKDYDVFMAISKKSGKDRKGKLQFSDHKIDHDLETIRKDFEKYKEAQEINW